MPGPILPKKSRHVVLWAGLITLAINPAAIIPHAGQYCQLSLLIILGLLDVRATPL
jgi:hypothetical protein